MASIRKFWRCNCKDPAGKPRGYKKVQAKGETSATCKHCGNPMVLKDKAVARICVNGKTRTSSASNQKNAKAFLAACETAKMKGDLLPGEEAIIPFSVAREELQKWAAHQVETQQLSKSTRDLYRSALKHLAAEFSTHAMQHIEKGEVEEFLRDLRADGMNPPMMNCVLTTLKRLFSFTCENRSARKFPRLHEQMLDVFKIRPQNLGKPRNVILENETEIQMLLKHCTGNLKLAVQISLNTGLRKDGCVTMKRSEILFPQNVIRKIVKGRKEVTIPMTSQIRELLQQHIEAQCTTNLHGHLMPSKKKPTTCNRVDANIGFRTACEAAAREAEGLGKKDLAVKFRELHFHDLRHTFATHYLYKTSTQFGATVAVHNLSKILGHSTSYVTERYSHVLPTINAAAMEVFGDAMWSESLIRGNQNGNR